MLMTNGHLRKFILLSCMVIQCLGYVCLDCSSSTSSRDCGHVKTCGPHEVCYADSFTTADGIMLEFGCRDKMQCRPSLIGKRSNADGGLLICSQCCHDDLCNANLCGGTGFSSALGPVCYVCGEQSDLYGCSKIKQCGSDQVCEGVPTISMSTGEAYYTGCEEKPDCEIHRNHILLVGRGKPCNSKCCSSNLCNKASCDDSHLQTNTVPAGTASVTTVQQQHTDMCHPNPCVHGLCYSSSRNYLCLCDSTYSGKNCDIGTMVTTSTSTIATTTIHTHCIPNPCVHGQCYNGEKDFKCVCDPTYSGETCDIGTTTLPPTTTIRLIVDVCTFQSNMCHWNNSFPGTMQWQRQKGTTPSPNTGPMADHNNNPNNYYVYLEASDHINEVAKLDSKTFPGGDYCVDFYYHMYGSAIGNLILNVLAGNKTYHLKTWSGDQGELWYHERIYAHIRNSSTIKFQFEGHTGNSYHSDMAIDDITIHPGNCTF